ncbi:MAG TPA: translocation/assembly module TamB domain-containing protein [Bacteroidales bacterium]|nr:translocation/assembly module TamB domain-containing protein [Bacteroidales bacterium]
MKETPPQKTGKRLVLIITKTILRVLLGIFLFLILAIALIQIPAIQNKIKQRFVRNLANKWKTNVNVGYVSINLWGDIVIRDIYIGDQQRDTLLNVGKIKVAVDVRSLFRKELVFNRLSISQVQFIYQVLDTAGRTNIDFITQSPTDTVKQDTVQTESSWTIHFKNIDLENIRLKTESKPDSAFMDLNLEHLALSLTETDLKRMRFGINTLSVGKMRFAQTNLGSPKPEKADTAASEPLKLTITLNEVTLRDIEYLQKSLNNSIYLVLGEASLRNGNFDALKHQMHLQKIAMDKSSVEFKQNGSALAADSQEPTVESPNPDWNIKVNDAGIKLNHIVFANSTGAKGNEFPHTIELKNLILQFSGQFQGPKKWQGNLRALEFTDSRTNQNTSLQTRAEMSNGTVKANNIQFASGQSFLNATAEIAIPEENGNSAVPAFRLAVRSSHIRQQDFAPYLSDSIRITLSRLPQVISYKGNTISENGNINTSGIINTSEGDLQIETRMHLARNIKMSTYAVNLNINELQAGHLLNNPTLGKITGTVRAEGTGTVPGAMSANASINIASVEYNKYAYKNIILNGNMADSLVDVTLKTDDLMLQSSIRVNGNIGNTTNMYLTANVPYANGRAMGLTTDTLGVSANMKVHFISEGNKNILVSSDTSDITIHIPRQDITSSNKIFYQVKGDTVNADIKTTFADIAYAGNMAIQEIPQMLKNYFGHYFSTKDSAVNTKGYFDASLKFKDISVLNALTQSKIEISEDARITASFRENKLSAGMDVEEFIYNDIQANDIEFRAEGRDSSFLVNVNLGSVQNPSIGVTDIKLNGNLNNGVLQSRFAFSDEEGNEWFNLGIAMQPQTPEKNIVVTSPLRLNRQEWETKQDNMIRFTPDGVSLKDVVFTRNDKSISIYTEPRNPNALSVELKNLSLSLISEILRGDSAAISGRINGKATVLNLFNEQKPQFDVNLKVEQIAAGPQAIGNLHVEASNTRNSDMADINLDFGQDETLFNVKGVYGLAENIPMNLVFTAHDFQIASIQPFASNFMNKAQGIVNASIRIEGRTQQPRLNGFLAFDKTSFFIVPAQTSYALNNQRINFEGDRIRFPNFTVQDANGDPLVLNGDVSFANFKNIRSNLKLTTQRFLAYQGSQSNIPGEENRVILTSNIDLNGGLNDPVVRANIQIVENSKFFYKITRGATNLSEEGVIVFTGAGEQTESSQPQKSGTMDNLNLTANIRVADNTAITIITDPARNIGINMKAGGVFSMEQRPNQAPRLTGKLNVSGGDYTIDFSGIKRKLQISDSSSIAWYGDIARPELNLRVTYEVRASPDELLGNETTEDKSTLPFLVNMRITGDLASPNLRFSLAIPAEFEGVKGGAVAAKLKEINYNESDVNQKAMALLLFGRFDFSDIRGILSSGGGGTNALITNALNQFTAQKIRFIDLHFDLESYNNYGEATGENQRTQLMVAASRKFLDNRLNTQVGATFVLQGDELEQQRSWVDKVSPVFNVSYILNKSRSLSVGAFRRSEYRGLIEGKVISTGAGLIFQKDFDSIGELFRRINRNNSLSLTSEKDSK